VQNLTPPFAPVTSISYKTGIFPLSNDAYGIYLMFFLHNIILPCELKLRHFDLGGV